MTEKFECNIPEHVRLVLAIDDLLREVDPLGFCEDSSDPHEYSPEIPGLVDMVVKNYISVKSLHAEFERMFYEGMIPNVADTEVIVRRLLELREKWLLWQQPLDVLDEHGFVK